MKPTPPLPDRRRFLQGLAMTGLALGISDPLHAEAAKPQKKSIWQPQLALSSVMFSGLALEAYCEKAAELGFKTIDLWGPFDKCRHMYEAAGMGPEAFLKMLNQHGLKIGVWTQYTGSEKHRGFPNFAEFIGACGGGTVVRGTEYGNQKQDKLEDAIKAFYEKLDPEIELARKHGVQLALENHSWSLFDREESFEWFHQHNPAPDVVGFAIAPYHLQRGKMDVADIIRSYAAQTLFFYAWQLGDGASQLPGHGPVDFIPWMQALAQAGYSHPITPFMHGELAPDEMAAAVAKSAGYLKQLKLES